MVSEGAGIGLVDRATSLSGKFGDLAFKPFARGFALAVKLIYTRDRPRSRAAIQLSEQLRNSVRATRVAPSSPSGGRWRRVYHLKLWMSPRMMIGAVGRVLRKLRFFEILRNGRCVMPLTVKPLTKTSARKSPASTCRKPIDDATEARAVRRVDQARGPRHPRPAPHAAAVRRRGARCSATSWSSRSRNSRCPTTPKSGTISSRDLPIVDGKLHVRGEQFHTDHSNFPAPPKATMLHAVALAEGSAATRSSWTCAPRSTTCRTRRSGASSSKLRSPHVYESSQSPRKMAALSPEERAQDCRRPCSRS